MRILLIGLNFDPEPIGVAPYTAGLFDHLSTAGHEVVAVVGVPHYPAWVRDPAYRRHRTMIERRGSGLVRRKSHYVPRHPALMGRLAMEATFAFRVAFSAWRRADLVVAVSPSLLSSAVSVVAARVHRKPVVVWSQDLYGNGAAETRIAHGLPATLVRRLESAVLRAADRVVVPHPRLAESVVHENGVSRANVRSVRNWTRPPAPGRDEPGQMPSALSDLCGRAYVLHVGNIGHKQGLEHLVDCARYAADAGDCLTFVILGDGSRRRAVQEYAQGVPNILFLDLLPDRQFHQLLEGARVLVVNEAPGIREMAMPSKLSAYFAAGRPIVAAVDPTSATAEEVNDSCAGIVVSNTDPAEFVMAVRRLIEDPREAHCRGKNGLAYSRRVLSAHACLTQWDEVLASARERGVNVHR
ncbi:glycosyltransferase [Gordonia sp. DT218]|uniref:glycosyltransferase n=1 Tax=unclassified Gordonia (in: high G+C Gram-positive bacteria) TaxID=2657482 RepID=UPI003CE8CC38